MVSLDEQGVRRSSRRRIDEPEDDPAVGFPMDIDTSGGGVDTTRRPPIRPLAPVDVQRSLAWVRWFGVGRLAVAALAAVSIAVAMWWLLRAPPVPVEQTLPFATGDASVTLPGPSTSDTTPATAVPPGSVVAVVHVAGNVVRPGVYTISAGSRVADAVGAAGGVSDNGDLDSLNLAAVVVDGGRIYVPARGEIDPASVASAGGSGPGEGGTTAAESGGASGPLDINTATAAELETLPGVGPSTAAAIVDDRERNGPFASVDDLERVRGIGPAKLAAMADLVTT